MRKRLIYRTPRGRPFGPQNNGGRSVLYDVAAESAKEGREAFKQNIPLENNPYPGGSINARAWAEGWESLRAAVERIGPTIF